MLLNEANRALQQHLQLQAGIIATCAQIRAPVVECRRTASSFTKLQALATADGSNRHRSSMAQQMREAKENAKESPTSAKATTTNTTTAWSITITTTAARRRRKQYGP